MRSLSLRAKLHILADSNNNISKALLTYFAFLCFWTFQKEQMEIFHASERFRNTKWNFFMLLHTTETPNETFFMLLHTSETPNETFSRFCTRQKHQMKLFRASAHVRNTKWNFFALLHTTETPNETFSRFCTRQKHQMELFHASAHDRNTKWKFFVILSDSERINGEFSCFCTRLKKK